MEDERISQVRQHILRQIERDQNELAGLAPSLDWVERVRRTVDIFVPRIVASAERLLRHVESSLNSPAIVRAIWREVRERVKDDRLIKEMDNALEQEAGLLSVITGDTVSKLIADFVCELYPD